jgi:dedicator of cytokinesis protein 3
LEAAGAYPEEAESARKERILLKAIDWFSSAKQWERAVPLIRELKHRYETVTYEYDKLAQLLQRESLLFSQIANTQRFFSNYFRVGFYGKGFNSTVRSKQFIYKGLELESLTDFTARLQLVYRKAEILKTTTISPEVENGDGQFLLVTAVNLSFEEERSGKKRVFDPAAPAFVLRYLENNDVDHFTYSKPFKGECVAAGEVLDPQVKEFASLWVRKHFMVTGETFPSYRKRLLVVETHQVDVSPIQNAVAG